MTEPELQDLHARFEREAFYHENGRPKLTPPVKLCDLAYVLIVTHHGYAHEWWKEYTGIIVLAKLIFHKTPQQWNFLYEVIPIKIAGYNVYIARSISASCVRAIDHVTHAID